MSVKERQAGVDPITLEVIASSLVAIAREMSVVMERTAYSTIFSEGLDYSVAVFDGDGRLAAQAERSPVHLAAMAFSVKAAISVFGKEGMAPGDVLIHNDPYLGGTHVSDVTVIEPVFVDGSLAFFVANRGHHVDLGGMTPGGFSPQASEVIQEGLVIPVVKLYAAGRLERGVHDLLLANVRLPRATRGDLGAQVGSCHKGRDRLLELVARYGLETVTNCTAGLIEASERRMRAEIAAIADGRYEFEDFLDDDGRSNEPQRIRVQVIIDGSEAVVDFTGTAPQSSGPINAAPAVTAAATYLEFLTLTDPTIPANHGCFQPIRVIAPEGTLVNPRPPAACQFGNTETSQRIADAVRGALATVVPGRAAAACMGTSRQVFGAGKSATGGRYVWLQYPGGGYGASPVGDGESAIVSEVSNCATTPVEVFESTYPWRVLRQELRADSGGAGRFRGGLGQVKEFELLVEEATVTVAIDRVRFAPWGVDGGRPGAPARYSLRRPSGERDLPGKVSDVPVARGDVLVVRTPGGGGWGDPRERDPALIERDVAAGYVTPEGAQRDYAGES